MKKIISVLVIMTFLCHDVAFCLPVRLSTLRPPLQTDNLAREIEDFLEVSAERDPLASNQIQFALSEDFSENIEQSARALLPHTELLRAVNILLAHKNISAIKGIIVDFHLDENFVVREGDSLKIGISSIEDLQTADILALLDEYLDWDFADAIEYIEKRFPYLLLDDGDFEAVNIILHRRLGPGLGDLVFVVNVVEVLQNALPDKKIRIIFHSDDDFKVACRTKLIKDLDPEQVIQEVEDGTEVINLEKAGEEKMPQDKKRSFGIESQPWYWAQNIIGEGDISIVYALGDTPEEVFRAELLFKSYAGKAKAQIFIHELGYRSLIQNPLEEGHAHLGIGDYRIGMNPVSLKSKENYSRYPTRTEDIQRGRKRIVKKFEGWEQLNTVLEQEDLEKTTASDWGFVYSHESTTIRHYFEAFGRSTLEGAPQEYTERNKTFFVVSAKEDRAVHEEISNVAEQNGYNLFIYRPEEGRLELVRASTDSKATIIMTYSVPRKLFTELFLYCDDLPTVVSGQDNLANIFYLNFLFRGRPFFWEPLIFQEGVDFSIWSFLKMHIGEEKADYFRELFYLSSEHEEHKRMFSATDEYRMFFREIAMTLDRHKSFVPQIYYLMLSRLHKVQRSIAPVRAEGLIAGLPQYAEIESYKGPIRLKTKRFTDGELKPRILKPEMLRDTEVTISSSVENPDDLVEAFLLMGLLRLPRYDVKQTKLVLDRKDDITNGLDGLLRYFCNGIFYRDGSRIREAEVSHPEKRRKKKPPLWVDRVLYEHRRLEEDAIKAAGSINSESTRIEIHKPGENPLDWSMDIDRLREDLKGKNVILIHSMENNHDFAELLLMLVALRRAGIASISLINTYAGYSRQDKVFRDGEGISADTMLRAIDLFADNYLALNVHYGGKNGIVRDKTGKIEFVNQYDLYNLNAFIVIAEGLFDRVAGWVGGNKDKLARELESHPLLLVAPDDGAFEYVKETAPLLKRYIRKKYGLDIDVHFGYIDKERLSEGAVRMTTGEILGSDLSEDDMKRCWAFIIDDETKEGSTLVSATYTLVRKRGISWPRVLTGPVHGKLNRGFEPFKTGYTEEEKLSIIEETIKDTEDAVKIEPKAEYIDEDRERMPPIFFVTTRSVTFPKNLSPEELRLLEERSISIDTIISYAVKYILGAKETFLAEGALPYRILSYFPEAMNTHKIRTTEALYGLVGGTEGERYPQTRDVYVDLRERIETGLNEAEAVGIEELIERASEICRSMPTKRFNTIDEALESPEGFSSLLGEKIGMFINSGFSLLDSVEESNGQEVQDSIFGIIVLLRAYNMLRETEIRGVGERLPSKQRDLHTGS